VATSPTNSTNPTGWASAWQMVVQSLTRPYRVSAPMIVLVSLVPFYIFIAEAMPGRNVHVPALALDRALPLVPSWAIVYGSLYMFLIVLPVLVVRQEEHVRRTVSAYLFVWITAYVCFLLYPTVAPRPPKIAGGGGFALWGLRSLYGADPPYNCFPSLHVAHSFVSALTCYRVNRKVGGFTILSAALVALSTLFTKQHYVLDVIAGALLAFIAYAIFLRNDRRDDVPDFDRRVAPVLSVMLGGILSAVVLGFWAAYKLLG
jgi:membrane-associated phospholipid phosphatase